jgi:hypothetical protein
VEIKDCSFINNKALNDSNYAISGNGGGLYYTCNSGFKCQVLMNGINNFKKNHADNSGGGIKWDELEPVFTLLKFEDNYAVLYADNIGSFAQKLIAINITQYKSQVKKVTSTLSIKREL